MNTNTATNNNCCANTARRQRRVRRNLQSHVRRAADVIYLLIKSKTLWAFLSINREPLLTSLLTILVRSMTVID